MAEIFKADGYVGVRFDASDWLAGLLPNYDSDGTETRIGKGFSYAVGVDPLRDPGYLLPGFHPTAVNGASNVVSQLNNGVVNGTTAYMIGGTKLYSMNASTNEVSGTSPWPHTISAHGGHSGVSAQDAVVYLLAGTKYLFYSWNDTTDGDIGRYDFSSTFDDDYGSTVATDGAALSGGGLTGGGGLPPHPMIVGDDGVLYIGNGNKLAALDGRDDSDGLFIGAALDLPPGYIITSFAKAPLRLVIYAERQNGSSDLFKGEATAFFWDYVSSSYDTAIDLPGAGVNGGFTFDGVPGCFTRGRLIGSLPKTSRLLLFDGARFKEIVAFDGNLPGFGGVEVRPGAIFWYSSGNIFRWGTPHAGIAGSSLNIIATASDGADTTASGMLRNFFNDNLIVSHSNNGSLLNARTNYASGATAYTGLKQLPSSLRNRYRIKFVRANYWKKVSAGRGFRIALNTDNDHDSADERGTLTYLYDSGTDPSVVSRISQVFSLDKDGQELPTVSTSLGLFMHWGSESPDTPGDAPGIESVEVYLEPIAI